MMLKLCVPITIETTPRENLSQRSLCVPIAIGIATLRENFLQFKVNAEIKRDRRPINAQASPLARLRDLSRGEGV